MSDSGIPWKRSEIVVLHHRLIVEYKRLTAILQKVKNEDEFYVNVSIADADMKLISEIAKVKTAFSDPKERLEYASLSGLMRSMLVSRIELAVEKAQQDLERAELMDHRGDWL